MSSSERLILLYIECCRGALTQQTGHQTVMPRQQALHDARLGRHGNRFIRQVHQRGGRAYASDGSGATSKATAAARCWLRWLERVAACHLLIHA
jgi:hypothetical protein